MAENPSGFRAVLHFTKNGIFQNELLILPYKPTIPPRQSFLAAVHRCIRTEYSSKKLLPWWNCKLVTQYEPYKSHGEPKFYLLIPTGQYLSAYQIWRIVRLCSLWSTSHWHSYILYRRPTCTIGSDVIIILGYKPTIPPKNVKRSTTAIVSCCCILYECNGVQQQETIAVVELWACKAIWEVRSFWKM